MALKLLQKTTVKYLIFLSLLLLPLPLWARPLSGQISLTTPQGSQQLANSGVVYVVPDTPNNWIQLNGLAQRVNRWVILSRQTAQHLSQQDLASMREYTLAQTQLQGLLNRLMLSAQAQTAQTLALTNGQFMTADAPQKVILVSRAQVPESGLIVVGWWCVRTANTPTVILNQDQQLYQVSLPSE